MNKKKPIIIKMMFSKTFFKKYFIFFIIVVCQPIFSKNSILENINIKSKANGIILELKVDSIPDIDKITAWQAKSGWFYITMYEFDGDSSRLHPLHIPEEIIKFQIIKTKESIQLGLKLTNNINHYDFLPLKNRKTIYTTLHYSNEILSQVISKRALNKPLLVRVQPNGLKKWLYLTGMGITVSGLLKENENKKINNQTMVGIGILFVSLAIDKLNIF